MSRILALALSTLFLLVSTSAFALDCTPLGVLPIAGGFTNGGYAGTGAVPGELVCGTDFTGWDFHVYEFTLTANAEQVIGMAVNGSASSFRLLVLKDCDTSSCFLDQSLTGAGPAIINPTVCLGPGTYNVIVASLNAPTSVVYQVGTDSLDPCDPIPNQSSTFGTLKTRF
jgi:hypothetical protein